MLKKSLKVIIYKSLGQFGFRKQRSTRNAISKLTMEIFINLEKGKTAAIFFDIEKAYNKINRNKTFKQLENMGYRNKLLN